MYKRPRLTAVVSLIFAVNLLAAPVSAQKRAGDENSPALIDAVRLKTTLPDYRGPSEWKGKPAVLVFSSDGRSIALRTADKVISLYEVATGKLLANLSDPKSTIDAFAFSPDGRLAATRHLPDKTIRLWDTATGALARTLTGHKDVGRLEENTASVLGRLEILPVAFSPDGQSVLTEQDDDVYVVYDTATGAPKMQLDHDTKSNKKRSFALGFLLQGGVVEGLANIYGETTFSPDGRLIVTIDRDKFPKLWDAATGKLRATLEGHGSEVYNASFSPDSRLLVTISITGTMKLWDTETGALKFPLDDGKKKFVTAAWSPRGDSIALSNRFGKDVWIIGTADGKVKVQLEEKDVRRVVFNNDGSAFAIYGNDKYAAKIWDASTGELKYALPKGAEETKAAFWSPDGRTLVTANDKAVTFWNAETGALVQTLGESARYPVRFSPDGRTFATGSRKNVALLWELIDVLTAKPESDAN